MTQVTPASTTVDAASEGAVPAAVLAVVVTDLTAAGLAPLLDAVLAQETRPDRVLVVDRSEGGEVASVVEDHPLRDALPTRVHSALRGASARRAVSQAVLDDVTADAALLWVLPVRSIPEPDALAAQLEEYRRSPSVGVVGPKHVDATDPGLLRSAGISATRTGRVVADPVEGAPDQGQVDHRRDVLAVPFAGVLVEEPLVRRLRGWAVGLAGVAADLDLGWRSHATGRRVVLAPRARFRSAHGVARAVPATPVARRAARRVALARSAWWSSPFIGLWIALSTLGAGAGLLLVKQPRAAWTQLRDLLSLDPTRVALTRWRTRGRREVRRRHLGSLFVPGAVVRRQVGDDLHELLHPDPSASASSTGGPGSDPDAGRGSLAPHRPALLAALLAVIATVVAGRELGGGLLQRLGSGLAGGELTGGRASAAALWSAWSDGWTGPGLGGPAGEVLGQPHLAMLAVPTWVLELAPGADSLTSPVGAVVGAFLVLTLPAAALAAYASAGVLTRSPWVRAVAAVAWVATGVAGAAVAQGRLGAAVALVLLPVVAAGLVRITWAGARTSTAVTTALVATVLGAFAPALLVLVMLLALGVAALGPRGRRRYGVAVAVVPVLLLGPWVPALVGDWRLVASGPGLLGHGTVPAPWQLALLDPGGPGSGPWWMALPLLVLGLLGLARSRDRVLPWVLSLVGLLGLAAALLAPRLQLAVAPVGSPGAGGPLTPWVGTGLLVLALALVGGVALGLDALREGVQRPEAASARPRLAATGRGLGRTVGLAAGLAVTGSLAVLAWAGFGTTLHTWTEPRPLAAVDQAEGAIASRTLFLTPHQEGAAYRVVGREAGSPARTLPAVPAADRALTPVVTTLLGGPGERTAGARLAARAIGYVAVDRDAGDALLRRLDSIDGLTRVAPRAGWEVWRVAASGPESARPASPPRLRLTSPAGDVLVDTTGQHGATRTTVTAEQPSRLVVAEAPEWAGRAAVTLDGTRLTADTSSGQPTYAVPAGTHDLDIDVTAHDRWWHRLQLVLLAVAVFLAVPFGGRPVRSTR